MLLCLCRKIPLLMLEILYLVTSCVSKRLMMVVLSTLMMMILLSIVVVLMSLRSHIVIVFLTFCVKIFCLNEKSSLKKMRRANLINNTLFECVWTDNYVGPHAFFLEELFWFSCYLLFIVKVYNK